MKTLVSIPDDIFKRAERLAKHLGRSRSDLYSAALETYLERHVPGEVTRAMNRVCEAIEQQDGFVMAAGRRHPFRLR